MPRFTREQEQIIQQERGNILVSAAAGSGKTTVMVERIIQRIRSGEVDVSGLLVLTFTDAAAANMKSKISKSLHESILQTRDDRERQYLSRQALYLPYAKISTIHSFCLSVVKEFAYLLNVEEDGYDALDADFRTADQIEADELFQEAVDSVLREYYERLEILDAEHIESEESEEALTSSLTTSEIAETEDFLLMLDSYAGSKSDDAIRRTITQAYKFLRSMPDYNNWVESELTEVALAASDFNKSRALQLLRYRLLTVIESLTDDFEHFNAMLDDPMTQLAAVSKAHETIEMIDACRLSVDAIMKLYQALKDNPLLAYDDIAMLLKDCQFPPIKRYKGHHNRNEIVDMIQYTFSAISGFYKTVKDAPRGTMPAFAQPQEQIEADISAMLPVLRSLMSLVLKTDKRYTALKQDQAVIDFNDFEHLALALLRKTEVIDAYVSQIKEIYVDEYQDTSSIQDSIISAVSQNNTFVVGDVKQSIYRFRHARPEIFNGKMRALQVNPAAGTVLLMSQNFRSVSGILDAVNSIFERVMEERTGEIDYQDGHALRAFHPDHPDVPQAVEFIMIDKVKNDDEAESNEASNTQDFFDLTDDDQQSLGMIENEGMLVADIIMKERYGQGNPLAPKFSDITILCMTHNYAQKVSEQLRSYGFPVAGEEDSSYLGTNELRVMEALIDLLGNELQDIPLLTCLRQLPVYGRFSDEELLEVKAFSLRHNSEANPYAHYHEVLAYYEEHGDNPMLKSRFLRFREWIHKLRAEAVYLSLEELIAQIYQDCSMLQSVAAEEDGEKRVYNLRQFQDWASQYESRGRRGLAYFVSYLSEKRRQGATVTPFEEADPADNSIRVITYHKSKGLEFPVVFLIGLHAALIRGAGKSERYIEYSEKSGLAFQIRRPDQLLAYPSVITMAHREEMDDAAYAESMRLLYVAMTRAEKKLYLLTSVSRGLTNKNPYAAQFQKKLLRIANRNLSEEDRLEKEGRVKPYDRADLIQAKSFADLIWMSQLAANPDLYDFFSTGEALSSEIRGPWRYRILNSQHAWPSIDSFSDQADSISETNLDLEAQPASFDKERFDEIRRSHTESYPYAEVMSTPQKFAVSELKRRMQHAIVGLGEDARAAKEESADGKMLDSLATAGINTMLDLWLDDSWGEVNDTIVAHTASERGTLLHTTLRFLDVDAIRGGSVADVHRVLASLNQQSVLSAEELSTVSRYADKLLAYSNSDIAAEVLEAEHRGKVYKEVPFTLAQRLSDLPGFADQQVEDTVLIQGIIDLWFSLDSESVLLDYKSDILKGPPDERAKILHDRYQIQLELYSRAIFAATGKQVKKRLIWSIPDARVYEIASLT